MISATERNSLPDGLSEKYASLESEIRRLAPAAVAFSGGADSALLLYAAASAIPDRCAAVTIWSPLLSQSDKNEIVGFCRRFNIRLIKVEFDETELPEFTRNDMERCYYCKTARLAELEKAAAAEGFRRILDGSNTDDLSDYRPGMRALKACASAASPFLICGISKAEIRTISAAFGLPTAFKPASACLASRIKSGVTVEKGTLASIEAGEEYLRGLLPRDCQLRLRFDGSEARIETETSQTAMLESRIDEIRKVLAQTGFKRVSIDRRGYLMGGQKNDG